MTLRLGPLALLAGLLLAVSSEAAAHDARGFISTKGFNFLEERIPEHVPDSFTVPGIEKSFACMRFVQRNTTVYLDLRRIDISSPAPGRLRLEVDLAVEASGVIDANNLYACVGSATCSDSLLLDGGAVLELDVAVRNGRPEVSVFSAILNVDASDVAVQFSGCGFAGDALTKAVDFSKGWVLDYLKSKISEIAQEQMAPVIEDHLRGLGHDVSTDLADFAIALRDLELDFGGLGVALDVEVGGAEAAAACVASLDHGAPMDLAGTIPNLGGMTRSSFAVAANFGLVNHLIYRLWRRGLMCLDGDHLEDLGLELDLEEVGAMLPGFPTGTEFSVEIKLTAPPRIRGEVSVGNYDPEAFIEIPGVTLDLHGVRPDGTRATLHASLDINARAAVGLDPISNSLLARPISGEITRMVLEDERDAVLAGFDVGRILALVHQGILPPLLESVGSVPITAPVFALSGYAVLLRELETTESHLSVGFDLFEIPAEDSSAPDTQILGKPAGVVSVKDAVIRVVGQDDLIPADLLQYRVTVDGEARKPSFVRDFAIGEVGKTRTYEVALAAVDLAGNEDPTPATATVSVDGVLPKVYLSGNRFRDASGGPVELSWTMGDDTTSPEYLQVRVDVLHLEDPADAMSGRLIESHVLPAGSQSFTVSVTDAGIYRVEVHAQDSAGNDSLASALLTVEGSGCSLAGDRAGVTSGALLLLALALIRRRRA